MERPRETTRSSKDFYTELAIGVGLLVLVFLVYLPALGAALVNWDDPDFIQNNPMVLHGLSYHGIYEAFTTFRAVNWIPLVWISFMADATVFGASPFGYHFTNVLLHALNAIVLYAVFRQATGDRWRSLLVASLFAFHPLRVESVAWATERKDVLGGFFGFLGLYAYIRYRQAKRWPWPTIWLSASYPLFALSLMAKAMCLMLPVVCLLSDFWLLQATSDDAGGRWRIPEQLSRRLLEKVPFLLIAFGVALVTFVAQRVGGAVGNLSMFTPYDRISNAVVSYLYYIGMMADPVNLAPFYPHFGAAPLPILIMSTMAITAVSVCAWIYRNSAPWVLFGWLWYLIAFLPMIGLVQVGNQSMADRYSYFPMIGITVALVWSIPDRLAIGRRIGLGETSYRNAVAIACGLLILILAALSFRQATFWKNSLALWNHALASTEDNAVMRVELASSYYNAGDVRQALVNATRAIELEPANWNGYWERGRALEDVDPNQAIESFEQGIKVHPNFPTAYIEIGKVLEKAGQIPDAMSAFQQASTLDPADWRAAYDLGVTQIKLQNFPAAAQCFQQALDDGITDPAIEDKVAKAVVRWNQSQQ